MPKHIQPPQAASPIRGANGHEYTFSFSGEQGIGANFASHDSVGAQKMAAAMTEQQQQQQQQQQQIPNIGRLDINGSANEESNNSDNRKQNGNGGGATVLSPPQTSRKATTSTRITTTVTRAVRETNYGAGINNDEMIQVRPIIDGYEDGENNTVGGVARGQQIPIRPQHEQLHMQSPVQQCASHSSSDTSNAEMRYYRIIYRGVVSLLSEPDERSKRSGVYVSYGEIVATSGDVIAIGGQTDIDDNDKKVPVVAISVDDVLTGGYAIDADRPVLKLSRDFNDEQATRRNDRQQGQLYEQNNKIVPEQDHHPTGRDTPRRSNVTDYGTVHVVGGDDSGRIDTTSAGIGGDSNAAESIPGICGSTYSAPTASGYVSLGGSLTKAPSRDDDDVSSSTDNGDKSFQSAASAPCHYGYLLLSRPSVLTPIAVELHGPPPQCQSGPFLYKVASSTPLPIIAGPCDDAPRTGQAVVMPGTVHQISLRMKFSSESNDTGTDVTGGMMYLRLGHRRGWLADRRIGDAAGRVLMAEVIGFDPAQQSGAASPGNSVSGASVSSHLTSSLGSVSTVISRRRRRPPLRKRKGRTSAHDIALTPSKSNMNEASHNETILSQSQNDTFDYGFDCDGLAVSTTFDQDSHHLSPQSPARRINPSVATTSSPRSLLSADEEKWNIRQNVSLSSSFLDHSDRHTVAQSISEATMHSYQAEPSMFLMKATAPNGLKILDASHFQVNNLIHGQSQIPSTRGGSKADGGFHTMSKGFGSGTGIHRTESSDSQSRTRILPRGKLFEATARLEVSGLYSPGAGLIKLADNSGWAIVPDKAELDAQYRTFRGGNAAIEEGEASQAFKEVGNAITDISSNDQGPGAGIWLRIVHRGGVLVSCPPRPDLADPDMRSNATSSSPHTSVAGSSRSASHVGASSDVGATSMASSFLDAMFRTPRTTRKPLQGNGPGAIPLNDSGINSEKSKGRPPQKASLLTSIDAILPCGLCVEVQPWDQISKDQPSFARLRGGQGWIPRHMNGQKYVHVVDPPTIRNGSFWFRVKSRRGIKVRHGPSRRANSIKNEGGEYFRFECGEFLRASEICIMRSEEDAATTQTAMQGLEETKTYECFAKLYRNSHALAANADGVDFRSLNSLAAPGEWVQVYGSGRVYLEECSDPPRIERHRECWRYDAVNDSGIHVRKGPSYLSEMAGKMIRAGESIMINERVIPHGEAGAWLRLKDGTGWVHEKGEGGESVLIAYSLRNRTAGRSTRLRSSRRAAAGGDDRQANEAAYNSIIARLFHETEDDDEGPR